MTRMDERALEIGVKAHDKEDCAQKGEPDPWADDFPEPYRGDRIAAFRLGVTAFLRAFLEDIPESRERPTHRHLKSGKDVTLIATGRMQSKSWIDLDNDNEHKVDMREVAIYRHDHQFWVRPLEEFNDGRFAKLEER